MRNDSPHSVAAAVQNSETFRPPTLLRPMIMRITPKFLGLLLLSLICLIFLFIGGPDRYASRSFKYAWDIGHIVCFLVWTGLFLNFSEERPHGYFFREAILVLSSAVFLGFVIEWLQIGFNRSFDLKDIIRDLYGSVIAIALFSPSRKTLSPLLRYGFQWFAILLVSAASLPAASAFIDESIADRQFPVLSDFETPLEIQRWSRNRHLSISRRYAFNGKRALKVPLTTQKYSGAALIHFPGNWRGFRFLEFNIFNPSTEILSITCRVHDRQHTRGNRFARDRYNEPFTLAQGWNTIRIPMEHIRNAPKHRQMDMTRISGLGIFATRLPEPRIIYIDNVHLKE